MIFLSLSISYQKVSSFPKQHFKVKNVFQQNRRDLVSHQINIKEEVANFKLGYQIKCISPLYKNITNKKGYKAIG